MTYYYKNLSEQINGKENLVSSYCTLKRNQIVGYTHVIQKRQLRYTCNTEIYKKRCLVHFFEA
jgi:hypothetical protein